MWSTDPTGVFIVELIILWEEGRPVAHKLKWTTYSGSAAECKDLFWTTTIHPVEVGCRSFMGSAAVQLIGAAGSMGANLQRAIKKLAEEAEKAQYWCWSL